MRVTEKGQVTIPKPIRDRLAIAICHAHNRQGLSGRLAKLAG